MARKPMAERSRLNRRTSNAFHHCKRRANKAGEFLDFTVDTLRDKIAEALEKPCPYCAQPVTLRNFSPDHKQPLSRNGYHCPENVAICCRVCNFANGMLTDAEYRALLMLTKEWPPAIRSDFFARLRGGVRRMR
jgi:hypothetical protein